MPQNPVAAGERGSTVHRGTRSCPWGRATALMLTIGSPRATEAAAAMDVRDSLPIASEAHHG